MDNSDVKNVASVERALLVLDAFTREQPRMSLADLSERTGLYKSTILRLIQTLESRNLIKRTDEALYQLGPACLTLALLYQQAIDPMEVITPMMRKLVASTGESAAFNVRNGDNRVCVFRLDSPHRIRDHVQLGDVIPLRIGAAGHVLVAFSAGQGRLYDRVRANGVATTVGEVSPDTAAVAAPVFDHARRLFGAISISGPRTRLDKVALQRMEPLIRDAAREITSALGGDPDLIPCADSKMIRKVSRRAK